MGFKKTNKKNNKTIQTTEQTTEQTGKMYSDLIYGYILFISTHKTMVNLHNEALIKMDEATTDGERIKYGEVINYIGNYKITAINTVDSFEKELNKEYPEILNECRQNIVITRKIKEYMESMDNEREDLLKENFNSIYSPMYYENCTNGIMNTAQDYLYVKIFGSTYFPHLKVKKVKVSGVKDEEMKQYGHIYKLVDIAVDA